MKPSREQIIAWAREAGMRVVDSPAYACGVAIKKCTYYDLRRFVELAIASAGESEPHGWITMWLSPSGDRKPVYHPGKHKPNYGDELNATTPIYPVYTHPIPATAGDVRKPIDFEALVEDLEYWSRYVEVDHAHQSLEAHILEVLEKHGITDKEQQ